MGRLVSRRLGVILAFMGREVDSGACTCTACGPVGKYICFVRRIWARGISFFIPRARDGTYSGSGSAQSLLRICLGWLTFAHPNYYFRQGAAQSAESLQL